MNQPNGPISKLLRLLRRYFNSFQISLKLKSDEAILVAVKCNCNVINYV